MIDSPQLPNATLAFFEISRNNNEPMRIVLNELFNYDSFSTENSILFFNQTIIYRLKAYTTVGSVPNTSVESNRFDISTKSNASEACGVETRTRSITDWMNGWVIS